MAEVYNHKVVEKKWQKVWLGGISPIWFVLLGAIGGILYCNHVIASSKQKSNKEEK